MTAVAFSHPWIFARRQAGNRVFERLVQSQSDNMRRALMIRDGETQIATRFPQALDDDCGRIDQRAIPIENQ